MKKTVIIKPEEICDNTFGLIGNEWMLIAAEKPDGTVNFMTASWGGFGVLWHKNVCFLFVRPSRYTYEFTESSDHVTLSFFGEEYRRQLSFCGTKSGRDVDKIKECGFSVSSVDGYPVIAQARMTIKAKKLYADMIEKENFIDTSCIDDADNLHKMYVYEIVSVEKEK